MAKDVDDDKHIFFDEFESAPRDGVNINKKLLRSFVYKEFDVREHPLVKSMQKSRVNSKYTASDDEYISSHMDTPNEEIAKALGREPSGIANRKKHLRGIQDIINKARGVQQ